MTQQEVISYFQSVLNKLWPKWKANEAQVLVWGKALKYFDYNAVKRATEEHFTSQEGSYGRPKLNAVIEKAKLYQPKRTAGQAEPHGQILGYYLQRIEGGHKIPFYIDAKHRDNYDGIMRAAERRRKQAENLYGGEWIIIQVKKNALISVKSATTC